MSFADKLVKYINIAEQYSDLTDGPSRREFVLNILHKHFPDIDEDVIGYSIDLVISLSKAMPVTINKRPWFRCFKRNVP